jgi:hypothetical protein
MRRKLTAITLASAFALALPASTAFADRPHAGGSGKFKGSANPCKQGGADKKCPPHGGD